MELQNRMKAAINESGMLIVSAENGLEAYALKCWCKESIKKENADHKEWSVEKILFYSGCENDSNSKKT